MAGARMSKEWGARSSVARPGGRELSVQRLGGGSTPVVFDAGHGCDSREWAGLAEELQRDHTLIAYDRAGYGASSNPPADWSLAAVVADLDAVITATTDSPPVVVGHSLGGLFVRAWASQNPDRCRAVVLLDPTHENQESAMKPWARVLSNVILTTLFGRRGVATWKAKNPGRGRGPTVEARLLADLLRQAREWKIEIPGRVPVEVVCPAKAARLPGAGRAEMVRSLGRPTLVSAGHFVHRGAPDEVLAVIRGVGSRSGG